MFNQLAPGVVNVKEGLVATTMGLGDPGLLKKPGIILVFSSGRTRRISIHVVAHVSCMFDAPIHHKSLIVSYPFTSFYSFSLQCGASMMTVCGRLLPPSNTTAASAA